MIEPIFVIMMFDTLNARDLSLSLFFAFLSSYGSFSCVSFSDSFTFLLICFLKNSSLHERQERTFPSLPLSLFSYYFVLEKGREHLVIVFSLVMTTTTGLLVSRGYKIEFLRVACQDNCERVPFLQLIFCGCTLV